MITDIKQYIGRNIAYKTLAGMRSGKVLATIGEEVLKVYVYRVRVNAFVNVRDIIKVY